MTSTPLVIHGDAGAWSYPAILHAVLYGSGTAVCAPRGQMIRDAGLTIIQLKTPQMALPAFASRNLNLKIAYTETVQLVGGFGDENLVRWASPSLAKMTIGANGRQHGNYGRRIDGQMEAVARKLDEDFETRQAHVTLWNPYTDNQSGIIDYPCTSSITFRGRHEHGRRTLDMTVFMRSNDAWLGLPYDMFQFSMLHMTLAHVVNAAFGRYTHIANSMHIYERDMPKVAEFLAATDHTTLVHTLSANGFGLPTARAMRHDTTADLAWRAVSRYVRGLVYDSTEVFDPYPADWAVHNLFRDFRDQRSLHSVAG